MRSRLIGWIAKVFVSAIVIAVVGIIALIGYGAFVQRIVPFRLTITGRVTDSRGTPLKGAEVRAEPSGVENYSFGRVNPRRVKTTKTVADENGCYRLKRLVGGIFPRIGDVGRYVQEYEIVADAKGYAPRKTRVARMPWQHGKLFEGIDLALDKESSISGRAVDTRGRPLAGRVIHPVLNEESRDHIQEKVVPEPLRTDADGRFRFEKMTAGVYLFQTGGYADDGLKDQGGGVEYRMRGSEGLVPFYEQRYRGRRFVVPQISRSKPLVLGSGENLENADLIFEAPEDRGSIAGRVTDAVSGKPIEQFFFKIRHVELPGEGTPVWGRIRSGHQFRSLFPGHETQGKRGRFLTEDISPGTVTLSISAPGYAAVETMVTVSSGQTVETTFPLVRNTRPHGE
jgi:hypothetical protein